MCCVEVLVRYMLITANIVFNLIGLAILGLGIAVHIHLKEIVDLIPVNLTALSISIITIGCIIFVISFLACCGAINKSRCMLMFYALFMSILAGIKIYLTVIIFNFLSSAQSTVSRWIVNAFANTNLRPTFNAMELLFSCCGTTGAGSYAPDAIPPSCCASPFNSPCAPEDLHDGCIGKVTGYFENFGETFGAIFITIIIIELICVVSGLFLSCQIQRKRYASA